MNWEAVGAVSEIIGAIAVVVTLIYLARQVRQTAVATKAATLQSSVGNDMQVLTAVGATAEASGAFMGGPFMDFAREVRAGSTR